MSTDSGKSSTNVPLRNDHRFSNNHPIAVTDTSIREHHLILNKHETSVVLTLHGTMLMYILGHNMDPRLTRI